LKPFMQVLALLCLALAGRAHAALHMRVQPPEPPVFCGTCAENPASLIEIEAAGFSEGEVVAVKLAHQDGLAFSSGFPHTEGATLVETDFPVLGGKVSFKTHFPIRGTYRLQAAVAGQTQVLDIRVKEPGSIQKKVSLLVLVMLALGLVTGLVFGRAAGKGAVALLIACLLAPAATRAHGGADHGEDGEADLSRVKAVGAWQASVEFSPEPPAVGEPALVSLRIIDAKAKTPLPAATVDIAVELLEYETVIFEARSRMQDGKVDFGYGYFDGSGHRVDYTVTPDDPKLAPFKVSFQNEVEGKAPPVSAKLGTVLFLMLVMVAGFVVGSKFGAPKAA
jgi:hypothetical protein